MADVKTEVKAPVKEVVYTGVYRILNKQASPIEKVGDVYKPKNADEIAELEYHVKMGNVFKK